MAGLSSTKMDLYILDNPTVIDHVLVALFVIVLPVYSLLTYPALQRDISSGKPGVLVREYSEILAILWAGAALVLGAWVYQGRAVADLGFAIDFNWRFLGGLAITLILIAFLIGQIIKTARSQEYRDRVKEQIEAASVGALLPRTRLEYNLFVAVSITAGICEEIMFRGFLISYLGHYAGVLGAILLSSLLFGMAHAYQGVSGAVRTMIAGLINALLYWFSGTLWLPMILHAAIDIHGGTLGKLASEPVERSQVAGQ
jgi:membrane protease YdiL (CAAX protease family)